MSTTATSCVVYGRVTNLAALAGAGGVSPDAKAETIVARAYEARGERILDELQGEWSVVLRKPDGSGLAAADCLGGRPLHYRVAPQGTIEFAGEVKELVRDHNRVPAVDRAALAHWLARRPLPRGSTLFDGIRRLPAGHLLRLGRSRAAPERWWAPRYSPPPRLDRREAAAMLDEGMEAAVGRATAFADKPAVMLSGGFDSLAVTAFANPATGTRSAYSGIFPGQREVDESERIYRAARAQGLELTTIEYDEGSPFEAAAEFASTWALPQATPNGFVWGPLFARAARDDVDVLLDGEGGDELFGCSPPLIADRLLAGRLRAAVALARSLPGHSAARSREWTKRALRLYGVRDGLPPWLHRLARQFGRATGPVAPAWMTADARALLTVDDDLAWKRLDGPRWWAALVRSLIDFPDARGSADELRRGAAMHGVGRRHPWRDRELIELILALPPEHAFDAAADRPLAREALRSRLDPTLLKSYPKTFFNRLLNDGLNVTDRARIEDVIAHPPEPLAAMIDGNELRRSLRVPGGVASGWGAALWPFLSAAIWLSEA